MADDSVRNEVLNNIWPQERDYMARPERYRYLRRLIKPEGCVFCESREKGPSVESLCIYKTNYSMVVMNKFPYNTGHIMVIPQQHCGDLDALGDDQYSDLMSLLRKSVKALKEIYSCEGLNIGLNHGRVAGAGIPEHIHWHIIPRWSGDTNFFPLIADCKVIPETVEQSYVKIKEYFDKNL